MVAAFITRREPFGPSGKPKAFHSGIGGWSVDSDVDNLAGYRYISTLLPVSELSDFRRPMIPARYRRFSKKRGLLACG
jgi:hypothetical protein